MAYKPSLNLPFSSLSLGISISPITNASSNEVPKHLFVLPLPHCLTAYLCSVPVLGFVVCAYISRILLKKTFRRHLLVTKVGNATSLTKINETKLENEQKVM